MPRIAPRPPVRGTADTSGETGRPAPRIGPVSSANESLAIDLVSGGNPYQIMSRLVTLAAANTGADRCTLTSLDLTVNSTINLGAFDFAVAEFPHTGITAEIFRRDIDAFRLAGNDLLHRLAREIGQFAFEITNARFPRVVADQVAHCGIGNRPFVALQPVRLKRIGFQQARDNQHRAHHRPLRSSS